MAGCFALAVVDGAPLFVLRVCVCVCVCVWLGRLFVLDLWAGAALVCRRAGVLGPRWSGAWLSSMKLLPSWNDGKTDMPLRTSRFATWPIGLDAVGHCVWCSVLMCRHGGWDCSADVAIGGLCVAFVSPAHRWAVVADQLAVIALCRVQQLFVSRQLICHLADRP